MHFFYYDSDGVGRVDNFRLQLPLWHLLHPSQSLYHDLYSFMFKIQWPRQLTTIPLIGSFVQKKKWTFDIDLENSIITLESLNSTSPSLGFVKQHTIDIMLCYCGPNISSIGSIDDRDSTFVTKMSGGFGKGCESKDLQLELLKNKKTYTLHPGDPHWLGRKKSLGLICSSNKKKKKNPPSCGCILSLSESGSYSLKTKVDGKKKWSNGTYQDNTSILSFA